MTPFRAALLGFAGALAIDAFGADAAGIAGRWMTLDAEGHKRAVVEVVERDGRASGRIVDLVLRPDEDADPVCVECPGDARGRKIRGLEILVLQRDEKPLQWRGRVLDPEEGRDYRCVAALSPDGKRLSLRGYVGLELFGRTETWIRAD